jgi:hypothetical protein
MDPLSITASAIAIATVLTQTFKAANHLRHAPAEVYALINEVSDLTAFLKHAEAILRQRNMPDAEDIHIQEFKAALLRARTQLSMLETLMKDKILAKASGLIDDGTSNVKVSKKYWLRLRSKVVHMKRELGLARESLMNAFQLVNLYVLPGSGVWE